MWQDLKLPSEKKMLLTVYNHILDARLAQPQDNPQRDLLVRSFEGFRDGIVEVYFDAVSNIQQESSSSDLPFGVPAVEGLVLLFQIPSYLSAVEQGMIVQELNTILFSPPQDNDIRNAVLLSLQKISAMEPETYHEITLTNFIEKLPDTLSHSGVELKANLEIIAGHLQDLVEIACSRPCQRQLRNGTPISTASSYWHRNFDAMENKLLEKLDVVLQEKGQQEYANMILAAVCGGLQVFDANLNSTRINSSEPSPLNPKIGPYSYIVKALFQKVVQQKRSTSATHIGIKESFDEKFVQMIGRTAMWALRSDLTTPANSMLLNWNTLHPDQPSVIWTLFTPGLKDESLNDPQQNLQKGPADKCLANVLSMYLLAGHRLSEPSTVSLCHLQRVYVDELY
jgi:DNA repair/transcription protein MET18/MMS19